MPRVRSSAARSPRGMVGTLLLVSSLALGLIVGAAPPPTEESLVVPSIEDAYVVTDISSGGDPQALRDKNFGTQDFVKVWYAFQVQAQEQMVSVGLIKFDLSALADKDVRSAHLQLFAVRTDLAEAARLVDVSLAEGNWSEQQVTFTTLPQVATPPLSTAAVYGANVWYSWDLTPGVVRKVRDGSMAVAVGLRTLENKKEEQVVFASSRAGRNGPRLVATYPAVTPALPLNVLAAGAAGLAVLTFVVGILLGRVRRRPGAAARPIPPGMSEPGGFGPEDREPALPRSSP
jgi:hypothetical protein